MNAPRDSRLGSDAEFELWEASTAGSSQRRAILSATVRNRTHRIVRERAQSLRASRSRVRSLWVPLGICAGLLPLICFAVWSVFDQYEAGPTGIPDPGSQMFVFLMWCLPVTVAVLAVVWARLQSRTPDEGVR